MSGTTTAPTIYISMNGTDTVQTANLGQKLSGFTVDGGNAGTGFTENEALIFTDSDGNVVENEKIFPLPELLIFVGYTIILIIDKVLFDTHALFADDEHGHHHDPAEAKME